MFEAKSDGASPAQALSLSTPPLSPGQSVLRPIECIASERSERLWHDLHFDCVFRNFPEEAGAAERRIVGRTLFFFDSKEWPSHQLERNHHPLPTRLRGPLASGSRGQVLSVVREA